MQPKITPFWRAAVYSCNLYMLEQLSPNPPVLGKAEILRGDVTPIRDYNNWERYFGQPVTDDELAVWLLKFLAGIRGLSYEDLLLCARLDRLIPA